MNIIQVFFVTSFLFFNLSVFASEGRPPQSTVIEVTSSGVEHSSESLCTICLDAINNVDNQIFLSCNESSKRRCCCSKRKRVTSYSERNFGHNFHKKCLRDWLQKKNRTCPNCRKDVSLKDAQVLFGKGNVPSHFYQNERIFACKLVIGIFCVYVCLAGVMIIITTCAA